MQHLVSCVWCPPRRGRVRAGPRDEEALKFGGSVVTLPRDLARCPQIDARRNSCGQFPDGIRGRRGAS
eukprot:11157820-Lingulodinium_polyedra.AAC.1